MNYKFKRLEDRYNLGFPQLHVGKKPEPPNIIFNLDAFTTRLGRMGIVYFLISPWMVLAPYPRWVSIALAILRSDAVVL